MMADSFQEKMGLEFSGMEIFWEEKALHNHNGDYDKFLRKRESTSYMSLS